MVNLPCKILDDDINICIIFCSPVIGEEVAGCREETEEVAVTVMVEVAREECDTVREPQCETEYTEECGEQQQEECTPQLVSVCKEAPGPRHQRCRTLQRQDCESHWVGQGEDRVSAARLGRDHVDVVFTGVDHRARQLRAPPLRALRARPRPRPQAGVPPGATPPLHLQGDQEAPVQTGHLLPIYNLYL